jgi:HD-like signal output (HDOD) protein
MNSVPIDSDKAIKELITKGINIPAQPKVLVDLKKKLASEHYKMTDLARIISNDPGITAMLYKLASSPAFRCGKELSSIEQVLMLIGVKQTYNLVQAISLSTGLSDCSRKSFEIFWSRSQEIAQLAALIAEERVSVCNIFPDQAYMAGIFHECGVPLLMLRFPTYCSKLSLDSSLSSPKLSDEDALFKVDHCSIGYLVARHWNLPDFICKSILYAQEIPNEEVGAVRTLLAILQLAIHFHRRITRTDQQDWPKIRSAVLAELGIPMLEEQEYYEEISQQFYG